MENTTENKLKFFAQYFGQRVLKNVRSPLVTNLSGHFFYHSLPYIENYYLKLRDINSITDDECIEFFDLKHGNILANKVEIKTKILDIKKEVGWLKIREIFTSIEIDFFRRKGFLVPFMNLTTDQILEFGWAKIKDNEK